MTAGTEYHDNLWIRLEKLERRERILRRTVTAAALALLGLALLSATPPKTPKSVEAQSFIITDMSGKQRGAFGVTTQGEPGIVLLDEQGRHRIRLRVNPDGTVGMGFFDKSGTLRVSVGSHPDGEGLLILDARQRLRVGLVHYPSGSSALTFLDADGKETWTAPNGVSR